MSNIPFNEENRAKMMEVANRLSGTCGSLQDAINAIFGDEVEQEDIDILLLHELDDQTMECQGCNWWCETHELDDEQVCDDCR